MGLLSISSGIHWNLSAKITFRFFFVYFILYALPFPLGWLPFTGGVWPWYANLWFEPIVWAGKNLLSLDYEITVMPNGSGDTTYNYVQIFLIGIITVASTLIWSVLDRKRANYEVLFYWLCVFIRYYLAIIMLVYGFAKVFKLQFPFPFLNRLLEPYGESSPMGLLWTFMGYSFTYNVFAGLGELIGGFLLFFRRTTMLGSLILVGVMSHVVVLNFSYDVPVKLFSSHLLLMSIFLLAPDAKRLVDFFILNKSVEPVQQKMILKTKNLRLTYFASKTLFIGFVLTMNIITSLQRQKQYGDMIPKGNWYGVYDVETFVLKNDTLLPILNDTRRWKRFIVGNEQWATLEYMDEATMYYRFRPDTLKKTIQLYSNDSTTHYQFQYEMQDSLHYILDGSITGNPIHVVMKKRNLDDFLLINRGFHWINEYPFNR